MKSSLWGGGNAHVVLLGSGRSFANFSLNIYPGDKIWFHGQLSNAGGVLEAESLLGGSSPHVLLHEAGCHVCHTIDLKPCKKEGFTFGVKDVANYVYLSTKTVLNFLLNPVLIFK